MNVIKLWALWGSSLRIGSNSPKSMITKAPKGFFARRWGKFETPDHEAYDGDGA
jgi:hypothetical protein